MATDHVIESFRNDLWPGYKTAGACEPAILAQFEPAREALAALGVVVWPMVDHEADDALGSAAAVAAADPAVDQVLICTPDKDLAQCVGGDRVVQLDRRKDAVWPTRRGLRQVRRAARRPSPTPGSGGRLGRRLPRTAGWGRRSAAVVLAHYGHIADIPDDVSDWDGAVRAAVRGAPRAWPPPWPPSGSWPGSSATWPRCAWTHRS